MAAKLSSKEIKRKKNHLLSRDGNYCWLCKKVFTESDSPTLDHVIPKNVGGTNELANLKLAHSLCDDQRGDPITKGFNPTLNVKFAQMLIQNKSLSEMN